MVVARPSMAHGEQASCASSCPHGTSRIRQPADLAWALGWWLCASGSVLPKTESFYEDVTTTRCVCVCVSPRDRVDQSRDICCSHAISYTCMDGQASVHPLLYFPAPGTMPAVITTGDHLGTGASIHSCIIGSVHHHSCMTYCPRK